FIEVNQTFFHVAATSLLLSAVEFLRTLRAEIPVHANDLADRINIPGVDCKVTQRGFPMRSQTMRTIAPLDVCVELNGGTLQEVIIEITCLVCFLFIRRWEVLCDDQLTLLRSGIPCKGCDDNIVARIDVHMEHTIAYHFQKIHVRIVLRIWNGACLS